VFPDELLRAADRLLARLRARSFALVTAESCTGGLIAGLLTEIAGSSDVVERGFVTYSNAAKTECLGVEAELLARHGAVSAEAARAMAEGALAHARADIAVAVTGVAGPGGGSAAKPVGLVYLAVACKGGPTLQVERQFSGLGRSAVRLAAVAAALDLIEEAVER